MSREQAYEILRRNILRWGMRFYGGARTADAEDNTHDVVASTLPHLRKLPDYHALSAYLYRAARNRYVDTFRTLENRQTVALQELSEGSRLGLQVAADQTESPEDRVARVQQQEIVHRAVLALPARYRIVLLLHDVEQMNTDLVARIAALDPGTVRVQLHRARLLLRRRLNALLCHRRIVHGTGKRSPALSARLWADVGIAVPVASDDFAALLERMIDNCRALPQAIGRSLEMILQRELNRERIRLRTSILAAMHAERLSAPQPSQRRPIVNNPFSSIRFHHGEIVSSEQVTNRPRAL